MKKLAVKTLAFFLATALFLTVLPFSSIRSTQVMSQAVATTSEETCYDEIIAQYVEATKFFFYTNNNFDLAGDKINPQMCQNALSHEREYDSFSAYYALEDINGDGRKELFIGAGVDASSISFYDAYTWDETDAISLFPGITFGERARFWINSDNIFIVSRSGGAALSSVGFFRYIDKMPALIEEVGVDGTPYHIQKDGTKVASTLDKNNAIEQNYETGKKQLSWIQITRDFYGEEPYEVGDLIEFGSYPQFRVIDTTTLAALNAKLTPGDWKSYGYYSGTGSVGTMVQSDYMQYADIPLGKIKYRAVKFSSYRPSSTYAASSSDNSCQDDNYYNTNTVYWFRYSPIRWRVLDPVKGLVMSVKILDAQAYNNTLYKSGDEYYSDTANKIHANRFLTSSIRTWLNNDFYNIAFSALEKEKILTTEIDSDTVPPVVSVYGTTNDNLFLLSLETLTRAYGYTNAESCCAQGTLYAKVQGLEVSTQIDLRGNSCWWLRTSAGRKDPLVCIVTDSGESMLANFEFFASETYDSSCGVRPAMCINLSFQEQPAPFDEHKYKADIWLNLRKSASPTKESVWLSSFLTKAKSANYGVVEEIADNVLPNIGITIWESMEMFFEPVEGAKIHLRSEKELYQGLVCDLINEYVNNGVKQEDIHSQIIETTSFITKHLKNTVSGVNDIKDLRSAYKEGILSFDESWDELFKNKKWSPSTKEIAADIGFIMDAVETIVDFKKFLSCYIAARTLQDEIWGALEVMKNETWDEDLREAIDTVIQSIGERDLVKAILIAGENVLWDTALIAADIVGDPLLDCIPIYREFRAIYKVEKKVMNLVLNTENIMNKYYLSLAASNLFDAAKRAVQTASVKYRTHKDSANAGVYCAAVNLFKSVVIIDMRSFAALLKSYREEGLWNISKNAVCEFSNWLFGDGDYTTTYEDYCNHVSEYVEYLNYWFDMLNTSWIMREDYLRKDYPLVYPSYARDEMMKDRYKPIVLNKWIDMDGKTYVICGLPYDRYNFAFDFAMDGYKLDETVAGEKMEYANAENETTRTIVAYNEGKREVFPKDYKVYTYTDSADGILLSQPEAFSMYSPLRKPDLSKPSRLSPMIRDFEELLYGIVVSDLTYEIYTTVTYEIYKSENGGAYEKVGEMDRSAEVYPNKYLFVDREAKAADVVSYKVRSTLVLDNGVTLTQESDPFSVRVGDGTKDFNINIIDGRKPKPLPQSSLRVAASVPAAEGIEITWDSAEGATAYEVYRKPDYSNVFKPVGTTDGACQYLDTAIEQGMTYDYFIQAIDGTPETPVYLSNSETVPIEYERFAIVAEKTTITVGETLQLDLITKQTDITWETDDKTVAAVDDKGLVSAIKPGTVTIKATAADGLSDSIVLTVEKPEFRFGDVNANGRVTACDARLALRYAVGLERWLTSEAVRAADVDCDGAVTAADARLILRFSVGLETSLGNN